jgi:transcriptional regulator with XRE-family HTH domain
MLERVSVTNVARGQAKRFEDHLAERLRDVRQEAGLRQSEVARSMRALGLAWSQATVSGVEIGRRELSTIELVAICGVLGTSLSDLVGRRGEVVVGENALLKVGRLNDAITSGRPLPLTPDQRFDADDEATRNAARTLGSHYARSITTDEVDQAARALWGVSLSVERESRLEENFTPASTPRQRQARRGHMTRRLLDELRLNYFDVPVAERPQPDPDPFPEAVDLSGTDERRRRARAR